MGAGVGGTLPGLGFRKSEWGRAGPCQVVMYYILCRHHHLTTLKGFNNNNNNNNRRLVTLAEEGVWLFEYELLNLLFEV